MHDLKPAPAPAAPLRRVLDAALCGRVRQNQQRRAFLRVTDADDRRFIGASAVKAMVTEKDCATVDAATQRVPSSAHAGRKFDICFRCHPDAAMTTCRGVNLPQTDVFTVPSLELLFPTWADE